MAGTLSNIKVEPMLVTWDSVELGFTDASTEVSFEETLVDVMGAEEGSEILDQIRTGRVVTVTCTLKEVTTANIMHLLGSNASGANDTPGGGTEVTAWGNGKKFTATSNEAAALILHPVVLDGADLIRDWKFHLAYPVVSGIVWSGEEIETLDIEFTCKPDLSFVDQALRLFIYGDHTQDFA